MAGLDAASLPIWDLAAALRAAARMAAWGLAAPAWRRVKARHAAFVDEVL